MISFERVAAVSRRRLAVRIGASDRNDGFTLIELVIAIAVGAVISLAVVTSLAQMLSGSARSSNHMTAVRQVQNAGYWVSRDAAMAHTTNVTTISPDFLIFAWTGWDDRQHQVKYVLEDASGGLKNLRRIQIVDGDIIGSSLVGQYIDPAGTNVTPPPGVTFTVTASVGTGGRVSTETRTYEVKPRPGT
jgi:prepilin-type N-terminal cleavage/methylation domain-containing protein